MKCTQCLKGKLSMLFLVLEINELNQWLCFVKGTRSFMRKVFILNYRQTHASFLYKKPFFFKQSFSFYCTCSSLTSCFGLLYCWTLIDSVDDASPLNSWDWPSRILFTVPKQDRCLLLSWITRRSIFTVLDLLYDISLFF